MFVFIRCMSSPKNTNENETPAPKRRVISGFFPVIAIGVLIISVYGFVVWFWISDPFQGEKSSFLWGSILLNLVLFGIIWGILVWGYLQFIRPLYTILYTANYLLEYRTDEDTGEQYSEELQNLETQIEDTLKRIEGTSFWLTPHLQETAGSYLDRIEEIFETNRELEQTKKELEQTLSKIKLHKHQVELEKAKSEAIIDSLGDGLIASSKDGNIFLINAEAQELVGCTLEKAQGKFIEQVLDVCGEDKQIPCSEMPTHRALEEGKEIQEDFTYTTSDGRRIDIEDIASPIISNGEIIGAVDLIRDVTKEREVERAQKEFVSIASHQFRTPVTSINWNAEMLRTLDDLPPEGEQAVEEIYTQNKRLNRLLRALLNLSRVSLGELQFSIEEVNLADLARTIYEDLQQGKETKNVEVEITEGTDITFESDRTLLRIVVENLLSNALKYTPAGGTITLQGGFEEEKVTFSVADTGIGIPEKDQAQIFTRLFRAQNARERDTDGTGLGLYIVRKIVEGMGGSITFESTEGEGTVFFVTLPRNLERTASEKEKN